MFSETVLYYQARRESRMETQARGGIKFFTGSEINFPGRDLSRILSHITPDRLRNAGVWRAEETVKAAELLFPTGRLLVEGEAQVGKGTILFGISKILDELGFRYVFIDGHHQETPTDTVVLAINRAQENKSAIFFDSFDYLFLKKAKIRRRSVSSQAARTDSILTALQKTCVPFVGTIHGPKWRDSFFDYELYKAHSLFCETCPVYSISPHVSDKSSITRFLIDHQIPEAVANSYVKLATENPPGGEISGDQQASVGMAMLEFAVLKILVREKRLEFLGLMEPLANNLGTETPPALSTLVLSASAKAASLHKSRGKRSTISKNQSELKITQ